MNRRDFVRATLATGVAGVMNPLCLADAPKALAKTPRKERPKGFLWGHLVHFGANEAGDWDGTAFDAPEVQFAKGERQQKPAVKKKFGPEKRHRFDYPTWLAITERIAARGLNAVVIPVCEGIRWPRHPELSYETNWEVDRFARELDRLRGLGLEPIPLLNFSATHDAWLNQYGHMMGTRKYYEVTADVIRDVCEVFGGPRYVHLGYEEEFGDKYERPDDLWWHDLYHLVGCVEKGGARAWTWTDYPAWRSPEAFAKKMPRSVLQSAWWYAEMADLVTCPDPRMFIKAGLFATLEKMGFDQIPCGGNCCTDKNMAEIVKLGDAVVRDGRLKGYLSTAWKMCWPENLKAHLAAVDQLGVEI